MATSQFLPLTRPSIDEATIAAVGEVLRSGWITSGPKVREFEAQLSGKDVHENLSGVQSDYSAALVSGRATWDLDPRWEAAILRCLEREPAARYQNGRQVLRAP